MIGNLKNKSKMDEIAGKTPNKLSLPGDILKSTYFYLFGTQEEVDRSPLKKIHIAYFVAEIGTLVSMLPYVEASVAVKYSGIPLLLDAYLRFFFWINPEKSYDNNAEKGYIPLGFVGFLREWIWDRRHSPNTQKSD